MLFYIDESVADAVENGDGAVVSTLKDLIFAFEKGKCLIDASRNSYEKLTKIPELKSYERPYARAQGIKGIYNYIIKFIQLVYDVSVPPKKILNANGEIKNICEIKDYEYFTENRLLCENIGDCYLYEAGTKYFIKSTTFTINCKKFPGGGSQIRDVAFECNNNHYNTLVILDSDKKSPNYPIGQTAQKYIQFHNALHSDCLFYYVLKVHEVENLIPLDIVDKLVGRQHKSFFRKLKSLRRTNGYNMFMTYLDFKKGFYPSTLRAYKIYNPCEYPDIKLLLQSLSIRKHKIEIYENGIYEKGEQVILGGWGDSLLSEANQYISSNYIGQICLEEYQEDDWRQITTRILTLGCAIQGVTV